MTATGPGALVLLHGFALGPAAWDPVLARLAQVGPVARPALAGHGAAPRFPRKATWDGELDRLAEEVRGLAAGGPLHLAGYSAGGRVALALAATGRLAPARLTLVSAGCGLPSAAARRARGAEEARWAARLEADGLEAFLAAWEAQPVLAASGSETALGPLRRAHDPRALARAFAILGQGAMPNLRPLLPHVEAEVHLIVGGRDEKYRAIAEEMATLLPRARLTRVEGAGHNVVAEAPELVARALARGGAPEHIETAPEENP